MQGVYTLMLVLLTYLRGITGQVVAILLSSTMFVHDMYEMFCVESKYISCFGCGRFSWSSFRFRRWETPGGRLYTTGQGRDPADLCGACTGRPNSQIDGLQSRDCFRCRQGQPGS